MSAWLGRFAQARIPVVSGIGHEIDFTIADFVADARAPTPSAAAEMVAPDRRAVLEAFIQTAGRLGMAMRRELRAIVALFDGMGMRLQQAHPGARLAQQEQRLDDLELRLANAVRGDLMNFQSRHDALAVRLRHILTDRMTAATHRLGLAQRALNTVSPLATLDRGFAIVTRASDGALITNAEAVKLDEEIETRLAHGTLRARVIGSK